MGGFQQKFDCDPIGFVDRIANMENKIKQVMQRDNELRSVIGGILLKAGPLERGYTALACARSTQEKALFQNGWFVLQ